MQTQTKYYPPNKSYKCMTRHSPQSSPGYFCYTFTAFAKYNFSLIQLYLLYFPTCFTRNYEDKLKNARQDNHRIQSQGAVTQKVFSVFFKTFCRLMVLHAILGWEDKSYEFAASFPYEFILNSPLEQAYNDFVKKMIVEICKQYQYLFGETQNKAREWLQAKQIMKEMRNIKQKLVKEAESNPLQMLKNQYFPACQNGPKLLSLFIKRNLEHICNIHVLRKKKKKAMLEVFQENFGALLYVNIPFLKDQKEQQKENKIYMLCDTTEKEPILTALPIYLKNINIPNPQINMALAQQIIKLFSQFMDDTKLPFPNLKLSSILINQKSLIPMYEQAGLILDAIGAHENTNTIELDITLAATPTGFDLQKCHLEYKDEVRWSILKKYYEGKRRHQNQQEDDSNVSGQLQADQRYLFEHIHVWRLLCVIYAVFNVRTGQPEALAHNIYQDYYGFKPFYKDWYIQAAQHAFKSCQLGRSNIQRLLNISNDVIKTQKEEIFSFTMSELAEKFEIDSGQDFILNNLKFESIYSQLSLRIKLIQQISIMFNKDFKRLLNLKKYIVTYLIQASQNFFESALFAHIEGQCPGSRRKLACQTTADNRLSIHGERKKRITVLSTIMEKLKSYQSRKDINEYLKKQKDVIDTINQLPLRQSLIQNNEKDLNQIEIQIKNNTHSNLYAKQYAKLLSEVKKDSFQSFNTCMKTLEMFKKNEIDPRLTMLQEFHKMDDLTKEFASFVSLRLSLLIQAYCRLRPQNWKQIELLVEPVLNRLPFTKKAMHSSEQLYIFKSTELQLFSIQERLSKYKVDPLDFQHENSWRKVYD